MSIKEISTKDLVEELRTREGVETMDITPDGYYNVEGDEIGLRIDGDGPAIILVVTD